MRKIGEGKTKTVFAQGPDQILLLFKDTVTGTDGLWDPGGNQVVGQVAGKGQTALKMSSYFFKLLEKAGIPTHYLQSNLAEKTMLVKRAATFGAGLEFICRLKATGSFVRRYGQYVEENQKLDYLVEITLKDDLRGDPLINEASIVQLQLMTPAELEIAEGYTKKIAKIIAEAYQAWGLELIDLKLEFGRIAGQIVLIDEISGDNMRVRKEGQPLGPQELAELASRVF